MFTSKVKAYVVLIVTIVALTLMAQLVIQYAIAQQKNDAHVINIAGRQRMLSQKLAKLVYKCQTGNCGLTELLETSKTLNRVHLGLQNGDTELKLPPLDSQEIALLFNDISPYQQNLQSLVIGIEKRGAIDLVELEILKTCEAGFLTGMEEIVRQFELRAEKRLNNLMLLEILLAVLSTCILLTEVIFIVRPALKTLSAQNRKLKTIAWKQSHEVRKPVANILGLTSIVNKQNLGTEDRQTFTYIEGAAKELDQIIHEIVRETEEDKPRV